MTDNGATRAASHPTSLTAAESRGTKNLTSPLKGGPLSVWRPASVHYGGTPVPRRIVEEERDPTQEQKQQQHQQEQQHPQEYTAPQHLEYQRQERASKSVKEQGGEENSSGQAYGMVEQPGRSRQAASVCERELMISDFLDSGANTTNDVRRNILDLMNSRKNVAESNFSTQNVSSNTRPPQDYNSPKKKAQKGTFKSRTGIRSSNLLSQIEDLYRLHNRRLSSDSNQEQHIETDDTLTPSPVRSGVASSSPVPKTHVDSGEPRCPHYEPHPPPARASRLHTRSPNLSNTHAHASSSHLELTPSNTTTTTTITSSSIPASHPSSIVQQENGVGGNYVRPSNIHARYHPRTSTPAKSPRTSSLELFYSDVSRRSRKSPLPPSREVNDGASHHPGSIFSTQPRDQQHLHHHDYERQNAQNPLHNPHDYERQNAQDRFSSFFMNATRVPLEREGSDWSTGIGPQRHSANTDHARHSSHVSMTRAEDIPWARHSPNVNDDSNTMQRGQLEVTRPGGHVYPHVVPNSSVPDLSPPKYEHHA